MKITLSAASLLLFALAAACSKSTIAGKWIQEGVDHGMQIDFADDGQFALHGEGAEGGHEHGKGTWKLAGDKLTLDGKWESGKDARWTGTLADAVMTIDTDPGKPARRFRRK